MSNIAKKRILVADDDPGMRLALVIRLRANNYDVTCAADGLSVVAEARRALPDLIILDLGLPAGDGFLVLKMLRAARHEPEAAIPVIVLTGRQPSGNMQRAIDAGATMFLQKPVETSRLLNAIEDVLILAA